MGAGILDSRRSREDTVAALSFVPTAFCRAVQNLQNPKGRRRIALATLLTVSLVGSLCAVCGAIVAARANGDTLHVTELINNPDSADGHGNLIRADNGNVAYCAQGYLSYPKVGQTLERYGSLGIDELDYVLYHGYDGKVVTSVDGLSAGKSESATMAAVWLAIADKRADVLNFIPKYEEPFHGNQYYYERWQNIKDQSIKDAAWKLYQAGVSYAQSGGGGIEKGCAILWLNKTPGGNNKTFIYQCLVTAEKNVRVTFNKTSAAAALTDGNSEYALAGAVYKIYRADNGEHVATVTTDTHGRASCTLQPNTTYYAQETAAPTGYALSSERIEFTTQGLQTDVSTSDAPKTFNFVVQKRDVITGGVAQAGCVLAGAEYELTSDSTPGFTRTATTDENGRCTFESIPLGTIHVRETKAPAGYLLDQTVHEYHVGAGDLGSNDTLTLEPDGDFAETPISFDIEISKFICAEEAGGSQIETPGAGIQFQILSNTTGGVIGSITTGDDGFASTSGLWFGAGDPSNKNAGAIPYDAGGYTVHEVAETVPDGVTPIDDWIIGADQMANGARLRYIVNNKERRCRLQIVKVDAQTGERVALAGFTFELLDVDKQPVSQEVWYPSHSEISTFTTDNEGSVWLPQALKVGRYYLRETSAVAPYLLAGNELAIDISDDNPIAVVEFADKQAYGQAEIVKTCTDDDQGIEGVEYDVRAAEDITGHGGHATIPAGTVVDHVVTDADGRAQTGELPLGNGSASYEFVEVKTGGGHVLDATPVPFTLSYQDENTPIVYTTCKANNVPTEIVIHKTIKGHDGEALAGVEFTAWRAEDEAKDVAGTRADTISNFDSASDSETGAESQSEALSESESGSDSASKQDSRLNTSDAPALQDGASVYTVTTDKSGKAYLDHLAPGTWRICETAVPSGYLPSDTVHEVVVAQDGTIDGETSFTLEVENDFTKVDISKRDVTNEEEIAGARLTVTDSDGEVIESWTSTDKPHRIEALPPGTYTLTETQSPQGHDQAEAIEFTVAESGEVQTVAMYDTPITIRAQVDKRQQRIEDTGAEQEVIYSIDAANNSGTWVDEFTITDKLDCATAGLAKLASVTTPLATGDYDEKLNVWYHTTRTNEYLNESSANATLDDGHENPWLETCGRRLDYSDWHLWKQDVSTTASETLDASKLDLAEGEIIDAIRFEFGCVDRTFATRGTSWDREVIKDRDDTVDKIEASTDTNRSGAIVRLVTTAAFKPGIDLSNSALVDAFRNGGGNKLEAHDEDTVTQKVVPPLAQTGSSSAELPLIASLFCFPFAAVGAVASFLARIAARKQHRP